MMSFCTGHFVQIAMTALKLYYFGPNMVQTPKLKAVKIGNWIIPRKKILFIDFVKDAKSIRGFSPSHQFRVGCRVQFKMAASEVAFSQTHVFRIAGTLAAETSVSEKAECLLAIGKDKITSLLE